jgi:hypothetical protein
MDYINLYEVAKQLNVSHTTIYNKLKNKDIYKELKPFIKRINKVKHLHIEGIELLRQHIAIKDDSKVGCKVDLNNVSNNNSNEQYNKLMAGIKDLQVNYITSLQDQIKQLENQVNEKDNQLNNKDELLRNFQVLLKTEKETNVKLLQEKNTSLWRKLFKKEK